MTAVLVTIVLRDNAEPSALDRTHMYPAWALHGSPEPRKCHGPFIPETQICKRQTQMTRVTRLAVIIVVTKIDILVLVVTIVIPNPNQARLRALHYVASGI